MGYSKAFFFSSLSNNWSFFDNFWLLIRPCCLIVYILFFLSPQPFHEFFLLKFTISPTTSHLLSQSLGFFSGINPSTPLIRNNAKRKKLHNYPFFDPAFFS